MRYFSVGELWGPFPCDMRSCKGQGWGLWLTDEEEAQLPVESGPEAIQFLLRNKLGTSICSWRHPRASEANLEKLKMFGLTQESRTGRVRKNGS